MNAAPQDLFRARIHPTLAVVLNPRTGEIMLHVTASIALQAGQTFVIDSGDHALIQTILAARSVASTHGLRRAGKPTGGQGR